MSTHIRPSTLVRLRDVVDPDVDLVLIPGAGSAPSFYGGWRDLVPDDWRVTAIRLPGRGGSHDAAPVRTIAEGASVLASALTGAGIRQPVVFGHSMGALLALELAAISGDASLLLVAACAPPEPGRPLDELELDKNEVKRALREMLGPFALDEQIREELVEMNTALMLADVRMIAGYLPPTHPLKCSIVSYYGAGDDIPPDSWNAFTAATSSIVTVPGDHQFPQQAPDFLIDDIIRRVHRRWRT